VFSNNDIYVVFYKSIPPDLHHFLLRARDTGAWNEETISEEQLLELLRQKLDAVNFDSIRDDVVAGPIY
jgi:hypothetical protein